MFEEYKCFFMNEKFGNCNDFVKNDFVKSDFSSNEGVVLTLKEAVEYQKKHNKPILVYENTNKELVKYFISIGGKIEFIFFN